MQKNRSVFSARNEYNVNRDENILSVPHVLWNIQLPGFSWMKALIIAWLESMCILSEMSRLHIIDCNKLVLYIGTSILTQSPHANIDISTGSIISRQNREFNVCTCQCNSIIV